MTKNNKPDSDKDVYSVMKEYCQTGGYTFSDTQISFMAKDCYLFFEGKGWKGVKYWPAVAKRWCLNNLRNGRFPSEGRYAPKQLKQGKRSVPMAATTTEQSDGKRPSVRDVILRQENNNEE